MTDSLNDSAAQKVLEEVRVLVVDASQLDRESTLALFNKLGIRHIHTAETGSVAIAKVKDALAARKPFHLVLIDAKTPVQDGLSFLEWMQSYAKLRQPKVIVSTCSNERRDLRDFINLRVNAFIEKPLALDHFKTKLLECLHLMGRTAA